MWVQQKCCQAAAKRALCSILSVCNNFVNCQAGFCLLPTNSIFQMKNLNKLADVDSDIVERVAMNQILNTDH